MAHNGGMDLDAFLPTAVELLSVPSTSDRLDQLRRAVDLVVDFVGSGYTLERFESDGKPSALLWAGVRPRPELRVIFNAHLDVVPADAAQFEPRTVGDRLYARGAQDMKVSALVLAQVFRELASTLPYALGLQLVADEEVGGSDGTLHQLQTGVTGEFVVIGEHSGLNIVADSKGLVQAILRATGRAAHGAYPWLGDNALMKLVRTVTRLMAHYPPATEEAWRTTVNLARLETPNRAFNQIPADAQAWLDIRFPVEDDDLQGRSASEISDFLQSFCDPGMTVLIHDISPPHHADHDRPEVIELRRAAQAQGYPSEFLYKHGSGDSAFYSERGIPAVAFGVEGGGQHGSDEYVEIASIVPYHQALTDFLLRLRPAPNG
jgi:succinyl-diaminopimelate desuccinylase